MMSTWNWVLSGSAGFVGGLLGGTFKWFVPSFTDLKDEWRSRAERKLDAKILRVLSDHQIRKTREIAESLNKEQESVIGALSRLEERGRVRSDSGTFDDPGRIYWILDQ